MFWNRKREDGRGKSGKRTGILSRKRSRSNRSRGAILALAMVLFFSTAQPIQGVNGENFVLSERERALIIRAVAAECPEASYGVQVGLAGVILRRLESGFYGEDAANVIYAAGFLRCTKSGRIAGYIPSEDLARAESAVEAALLGGDPTGGALYFATPENRMTPPSRITYRQGGYIFGKR